MPSASNAFRLPAAFRFFVVVLRSAIAVSLMLVWACVPCASADAVNFGSGPATGVPQQIGAFYSYDPPAATTSISNSRSAARIAKSVSGGALRPSVSALALRRATKVATLVGKSPRLEAGGRRFIYGGRVLNRAKEAADANHNFPNSFDREVLTRGTRTESASGTSSTRSPAASMGKPVCTRSEHDRRGLPTAK